MRLNVHDYSGHPFQVQLSRALAARGHDVLHNYALQYVTGHGDLEVGPQDPATLRIEALKADIALKKYNPVARARFERAYADVWQASLAANPADVVVACNVPLFALGRMRRYFERTGQPWVLWHQDIYSLAIAAEASRRWPFVAAKPVGVAVERMERAQVRSADRVVAITDRFLDQYDRWGLSTDHVEVIPNWAPIDELVPGQRDNAWAREQHLPTGPVRLLYAGTLGRKHNPLLLLDLLDSARARGVDAMLVVCSQGVGADDLREAAGSRPDVRILGYQPAERFAEVLASADAVVALLEPDAAAFSVPSKVLSYLSAGRPIIGLMPGVNPAAGDIVSAGGFVAEPTAAGARAAGEWLATTGRDTEALARIGATARTIAEQRFDIDRIADRFEAIFESTVSRALAAGEPALVVSRGSANGWAA